jgi:hypothetical protein
VNVLDNTPPDTAFSNINKDSVSDNRPILLPDEEDFVKHKKSNKRFNMGIALNTYYSSSDLGATDKLSIGGGIQTEYAVSDLISFNTGILLTDHSLNTEHQNSFKQALGEGDQLANENYVGDVQKEIKLIGLDIPLNISLNFNNFVFTSGVSSLVYLKESYSKNYYMENTQYVWDPDEGEFGAVNMYEEISDNDTRGAFQNFDFAKLINLSVGYTIHLKKGKLIFEPFAKIPVGKMTAYNFSFGYGGLILRYSF